MGMRIVRSFSIARGALGEAKLRSVRVFVVTPSPFQLHMRMYSPRMFSEFTISAFTQAPILKLIILTRFANF